MKTWNELTREEKRVAFDRELSKTLNAFAETPEFFPEFADEIARAADIAERNRTPWFLTEII